MGTVTKRFALLSHPLSVAFVLVAISLDLDLFS